MGATYYLLTVTLGKAYLGELLKKVILLLKLLGDRGTLRATGRFMTGMLCEGGGGPRPLFKVLLLLLLTG